MWIVIVLAHWNMSLHSDTLSWFWTKQSLLLVLNIGCLVANLNIGCLVANLNTGCLVANLNTGCLVANLNTGCLVANLNIGCLVANLNTGCLVANLNTGCLVANLNTGCLVVKQQMPFLLSQLNWNIVTYTNINVFLKNRYYSFLSSTTKNSIINNYSNSK
jgi:hypothetical protein